MTTPSPDGQRVLPNMPAGDYQTFQIVAPRATHFRPGSCAEAECPNYQRGWRTVIDEGSALGQMQAHYVRKESGRRFTEGRDENGLTAFTFEAGQRCFVDHQVPLERPPLFVVRDGDWRGNPRGTQPRVHDNADNWVDEFAEHQADLAQVIERG